MKSNKKRILLIVDTLMLVLLVVNALYEFMPNSILGLLLALDVLFTNFEDWKEEHRKLPLAFSILALVLLVLLAPRAIKDFSLLLR